MGNREATATTKAPTKVEAIRILIVDDDVTLLRVLEHHLTAEGYQVEKENRPEAALKRIEAFHPHILLTDLRMPGLTGHDVLAHVREKSPETLVIMLTGFPTVEDAVKAMRSGAYDFIQKPVDREHLLRVVRKAADILDLRRENLQLRNLVENFLGFDNMVGHSPGMQKVYAQARQVAASSASIILLGETGTGKELLARAIHRASPRRDKPFVAVNCAAIPSELLESELFGHVKGAFTGAISDRIGRFQAAEGGTLFLDEIGDLPQSLQAKLLRVIQERVVEPIGSRQPLPVDFKLISATHRDLKKRVEEGLFREDLYYRLHVVPIVIPPLRDRKEDIAPLFMRFLKLEADKEGRTPLVTDPEVLKCLEQFTWPGNVRELENLARRMVALNTSGKLSLEDLSPPYCDVLESPATSPAFSPGLLPELPEKGLDLEAWVDGLVLKALEKHQWNQSRTARYLNITRNTLLYRMDKRRLQKP